jgi:hypothetical protein
MNFLENPFYQYLGTGYYGCAVPSTQSCHRTTKFEFLENSDTTWYWVPSLAHVQYPVASREIQENSNFEFCDTTGYWVRHTRLGTGKRFHRNSNFEFFDTTGCWVPHPRLGTGYRFQLTRLGVGYGTHDLVLGNDFKKIQILNTGFWVPHPRLGTG